MMPDQLDKESAKDAVKEALKEWLDEKFTQFGKWSAGALAAAGLAALVYFILKMNGYSK
jgi:hypothetical protein